MAILNYTTQIASEKTVTEIQRLLAKAKAAAVLTEYDPSGVLSALSFRLQRPHGVMSFRLPANIEKVYKLIAQDRKVPRSLRTREQASRVAWRIIKDWLEAQLAFVESEQVEIEQVFLSYMQNDRGVTLYEALKEKSFAGLALPAPQKEIS